jgi:hypothetical protein
VFQRKLLQGEGFEPTCLLQPKKSFLPARQARVCEASPSHSLPAKYPGLRRRQHCSTCDSDIIDARRRLPSAGERLAAVGSALASLSFVTKRSNRNLHHRQSQPVGEQSTGACIGTCFAAAICFEATPPPRRALKPGRAPTLRCTVVGGSISRFPPPTGY